MSNLVGTLSEKSDRMGMDEGMTAIEAVDRMQRYIGEHHKEDAFSIEAVCSFAGYSRRQADRLFCQYLGQTLKEYINAVSLTESAKELLHTRQTVLQLALNSHYDTPEGFSRSFYKRFQILPSAYREQKTAIPLFTPHPVSHYHAMLAHKEEPVMKNELLLCTVTEEKREKRKLLFLPSRRAEDYLSYCEEMGCGWEGFFNSIPEKLDTAALLELPPWLVESGFSRVAAGVEVPLDYAKPLPEEYRAAVLPECCMLYFQTEPFERPEEFGKAISAAFAAVKAYDPARHGYRFACEKAPSFNFGAAAETGARLAYPAERLK